MRPRSVLSLCRPAVVLLLLLVLVTALAGVVPLLRAAEAMSIRVRPAISIEPAELFVQVLIERNAENRSIRITAESQEYFTSSEAQLEGEQSARLRVVRLRSVPAGSYELRVMVFGKDGRVRATARTTAMVIAQ